MNFVEYKTSLRRYHPDCECKSFMNVIPSLTQSHRGGYNTILVHILCVRVILAMQKSGENHVNDLTVLECFSITRN